MATGKIKNFEWFYKFLLQLPDHKNGVWIYMIHFRPLIILGSLVNYVESLFI